MKRIITTLTAILVLIFSFSVSANAAEINFTDVKTDDWYYKNLQELVHKNIASGYPDRTYKPGGTLKFEEFIKMLIATVDDQAIEQKEGQEWYQPYIEKAEECKYITEQQKSLIGQNISRKTMAEILYNVLTEKENIKAYTDAELQYLSDRLTDINKADVTTLTINGIGVISGYPDKTFKPNNTLKRSESVAVISRIVNKQLRNPVIIELPDTRTLDELPEVDLSHLYYYPTLSGKTVKEENKDTRLIVNVEKAAYDYIEFMGLMHNRDYKTIQAGADEYKKQLNYYLNGYKEYNGIEYSNMRDYSLSIARSQADKDWIMSYGEWMDVFLDKWVKDTINNKVKVTSKFYTDENLVISADGHTAIRGILRIKYDSHLNHENIKSEMDMVESEAIKSGQRILNLGKSAYNIYMDLNNIPVFETSKWYEITMDIVVSRSATTHGLKDKSALNYKYIYPISIEKIK